MDVAIIGGASTIGSTVAYTIIAESPENNVTIVEKAEKAGWAHATDISHGQYHFSNGPIRKSADGDQAAPGTIKSIGTDEINTIDPDVVVITARAPPVDDPDQRGGRGARERELSRNIPIIDSIATQLAEIGPVPVIVITNPIDRITYRLWDQLDWSRERFIGFSLSETARTAEMLAKLHGVHPCNVYCPTMGEHGENVVPVFSKAEVEGEDVTVSPEEKRDVRERVLEIPFTIAEHRGLADSSRWVTSAGVVRVLRNIFGDRDETLCLSVPVDGEYGLHDGCLSVPVKMDEDGVTEIIEWDLPEEELEQLRSAHAIIQSNIEDL